MKHRDVLMDLWRSLKCSALLVRLRAEGEAPVASSSKSALQLVRLLKLRYGRLGADEKLPLSLFCIRSDLMAQAMHGHPFSRADNAASLRRFSIIANLR